MPDIDLDALEASAKAATQDEWRLEGVDGTMLLVGRFVLATVGNFACDPTHPESERREHVKQAKANAAHIIASQPRAVLALIERVRRAETALQATLPRPISEAPKDGTQIVTDAGIVAWSDPEGDGDGWYDAAGDWCGGICEPSVWAPLPQIHDPESKP